MDTEHLIQLNLGIENDFTLQGDLQPKPGREVTLVAIYRADDQVYSFFYVGMAPETRQELLALGAETLFSNPDSVRLALRPAYADIAVFSGVGCFFARLPQPEEYSQVVQEGDDFVIREDGLRASWAWTPDASPQACELAVETLPAYRGRGFGQQVAKAWAADKLQSGKIAFYSYRRENRLSAALAASLGVVEYAQFTTYSI